MIIHKRIRPKKQMHITRVVTALVIALVITVFVLSLSLFLNFKEAISYNVYMAEKSSISQISYTATLMADISASTAMQMYTNPNIISLLRSRNLTTKEQYDALNQLLNFSNSQFSPFFYSIYIYNGNSEKIYMAAADAFYARYSDTATFFDRDIIQLLKEYPHTVSGSPICRKIVEPRPGGEDPYTANVYTFIFTDIQKSDKTISSALIFNINESWIKKTISGIASDLNDQTLILDPSGMLISSSEKDLFMTDLSGEHYVQQILQSDKESGYFIDTVDGVRSLVIYTNRSGWNWMFVRIIPYQKIIRVTDSARRETVLISTFVFSAVLLFMMFWSYRIRAWVRQTLQKMSVMEQKIAHDQIVMVQEFLRDLILNSASFTTEYVREELKTSRIRWKPFEPYRIVLFKIGHYATFTELYSIQERSNIKRHIIGKTEARFLSQYPCVTISMEDENIVLLINTQEPASTLEADLRTIFSEVQRELSVDLSAIVSRTLEDDIQSLYQEYQKLLYQFHYRVYCGHTCILNSEEIHEPDANAYPYPVNSEKKLLQALNMNRLEEAVQIFHEIMAAFEYAPYYTFNVFIVHLAFSVIGAANEAIVYGTEKNNRFLVSSFVSGLDKMETMQEIKAYFLGLFEEIAARNDQRKKTKSESLHQRIAAYLQAQFCNPSISMDSIAAELGFSPAYFGRLFKSYFHCSFVDYVNNKRLEKAIELMLTMNSSNEEISVMVGYTSSSYFYKVFRKTFGVTPAEYKKSHMAG